MKPVLTKSSRTLSGISMWKLGAHFLAAHSEPFTPGFRVFEGRDGLRSRFELFSRVFAAPDWATPL
jgi:hypothetical protein